MAHRLSLFLAALLSLALAGCDEAAPTAAPPACAGAGTWEFLGLDADSLGIVGHVAVSPREPGLLLASTRADFSGGTPAWTFRSDDDGQTWQAVLAGGILAGGVRGVAFDFADASVAYALPYPTVAKSVNAGQTWFALDLGLFLEEHAQEFLQVQMDPTGRTLLAGAVSPFGGSLYRSVDGGTTWINLVMHGEVCNGPNPPGNCHLVSGIISLAAAPSDPAVVYAGTNQVRYVLRSDNGGVTWERRAILDGLAYSIAVDAQNPDVVYAVPGPGSLVGRSADGGRTWAPFGQGLPSPYGSRSIVLDPSTGALFLVGSYDPVGALWRRGPEDTAWVKVGGPVEGVTSRSALYVSEDGWLYVGGDGLWRVDPRTVTATEPGPCRP